MSALLNLGHKFKRRKIVLKAFIVPVQLGIVSVVNVLKQKVLLFCNSASGKNQFVTQNISRRKDHHKTQYIAIFPNSKLYFANIYQTLIMVHYRKNEREGFETESDDAADGNWKRNVVTLL